MSLVACFQLVHIECAIVMVSAVRGLTYWFRCTDGYFSGTDPTDTDPYCWRSWWHWICALVFIPLLPLYCFFAFRLRLVGESLCVVWSIGTCVNRRRHVWNRQPHAPAPQRRS